VTPMRERFQFVYLLASKRNGTLYLGVTSDLHRRLDEHRSGAGSSFTRRYGVTRLVWFEVHADLEHARRREKTLKKWNRVWKIALIERESPLWRDLAATLEHRF